MARAVQAGAGLQRSRSAAAQIHCMAGKVPPEQRPAAEKTFIANIARAADLAAEKNITLLIEPINPRDRPDYFLNRVEQAADIIAKVGRPNVQIQFDFYHVQIMGGDLITALREASAAGRPCADRRGAVARRAGRGRGQLSGDVRGARPARLVAAGSAANTGRAGAPKTGLGWARPYGVGAATADSRNRDCVTSTVQIEIRRFWPLRLCARRGPIASLEPCGARSAKPDGSGRREAPAPAGR